MRRLTVGCEVPRCRAAPERLPARAAARKTRMSSQSCISTKTYSRHAKIGNSGPRRSLRSVSPALASHPSPTGCDRAIEPGGTPCRAKLCRTDELLGVRWEAGSFARFATPRPRGPSIEAPDIAMGEKPTEIRPHTLQDRLTDALAEGDIQPSLLLELLYYG